MLSESEFSYLNGLLSNEDSPWFSISLGKRLNTIGYIVYNYNYYEKNSAGKITFKGLFAYHIYKRKVILGMIEELTNV